MPLGRLSYGNNSCTFLASRGFSLLRLLPLVVELQSGVSSTNPDGRHSNLFCGCPRHIEGLQMGVDGQSES